MPRENISRGLVYFRYARLGGFNPTDEEVQATVDRIRPNLKKSLLTPPRSRRMDLFRRLTEFRATYEQFSPNLDDDAIKRSAAAAQATYYLVGSFRRRLVNEANKAGSSDVEVAREGLLGLVLNVDAMAAAVFTLDPPLRTELIRIGGFEVSIEDYMNQAHLVATGQRIEDVDAFFIVSGRFNRAQDLLDDPKGNLLVRQAARAAIGHTNRYTEPERGYYIPKFAQLGAGLAVATYQRFIEMV